jgi:hypothetical protein
VRCLAALGSGKSGRILRRHASDDGEEGFAVGGELLGADAVYGE